ncbi:MAG TPA: OPT/YSL family transporter, partial [Bryobacterales bacterium]|nr:OPT/YSL family transporter [Bryobacterales bacterium]
AQGIVGGEMAWPLVGMGMLLGFALIMVEVRSPMLFAVGMYLPVGTTFAIFAGGVIRWIADRAAAGRGFNEAQRTRVENAGVLTASGFIVGEALMGLVVAGIRIGEEVTKRSLMPVIFKEPSYLGGFAVMVLLAAVMVRAPLANAGSPDEPAPPAAMM